jgi:hypothetical protein
MLPEMSIGVGVGVGIGGGVGPDVGVGVGVRVAAAMLLSDNRVAAQLPPNMSPIVNTVRMMAENRLKALLLFMVTDLLF